MEALLEQPVARVIITALEVLVSITVLLILLSPLILDLLGLEKQFKDDESED